MHQWKAFWDHLKDELDYKNCKTFKELVEKIDEYIGINGAEIK